MKYQENNTYISDDGSVYVRENDTMHLVKAGKWNGKRFVVAESIDGIPVIGIRKNAFYNFSGCEEIVLPDSVLYIGRAAFVRCRAKKIVFGESLRTIGDCAFYVSAIEEVSFPDSVVKVGVGAFDGCRELKSIHLNSGLKHIKNNAFRGCPFEKIIVPASVESVGRESFMSYKNGDVVFESASKIPIKDMLSSTLCGYYKILRKKPRPTIVVRG